MMRFLELYDYLSQKCSLIKQAACGYFLKCISEMLMLTHVNM